MYNFLKNSLKKYFYISVNYNPDLDEGSARIMSSNAPELNRAILYQGTIGTQRVSGRLSGSMDTSHFQLQCAPKQGDEINIDFRFEGEQELLDSLVVTV